MSNSSLFVFFNEYPILPIVVILASSISFLPILFILYISQIAPLHINCRYILCIWVLGFGASFLVNLGLVTLDLLNETGYMPLSAFEPRKNHYRVINNLQHFEIRFTLYKWYSITGLFSSHCELLLSIERIRSIIDPGQYHFSPFAWRSLIIITLLMMALSRGADYFVHNEDGSMRMIGCMILIVIEIAVLITGIVATRISRNKYKRMEGNCSLTVRYQTKETYEMSKAMIPAYLAAFSVKALNILVLWAYYAANDMSLTGYAQDYLLLMTVANGTFSMINLLSKHPQLRKHSIRKIRRLLGLKTVEIKRRTSVAAESDAYFSMYSASWN